MAVSPLIVDVTVTLPRLISVEARPGVVEEKVRDPLDALQVVVPVKSCVEPFV